MTLPATSSLLPNPGPGADDTAAQGRGRRRGLAGGPAPAGKARTHSALTPWLFLAPGLACAVLFVLMPFVNTVVLSFTNTRPLVGGHFVGLANYAALLQDPLFPYALRNGVLYVLGVVPPLVLLPLLLAMLVQYSVPGIAFFRAAIYTPVIASVVVTGLIWTWLLDSRGLVNSVMSALGLITRPIPFLSDEFLLLISAMVVTVWMGLGYYMIVYLAVLANVPRELHEAAAVDGAGPIRRFFTVTVPAMRPTMALIGILSSVSAFRVFSEVFILSGGAGGPGGRSSTLVMLIRASGTGLNARLGYSSAISVVLFVLTVGLLAVNLYLTRTDKAGSR